MVPARAGEGLVETKGCRALSRAAILICKSLGLTPPGFMLMRASQGEDTDEGMGEFLLGLQTVDTCHLEARISTTSLVTKPRE